MENKQTNHNEDEINNKQKNIEKTTEETGEDKEVDSSAGRWRVNLEKFLDTNKEDEEAAFKRRSSCKRTPPRQASESCEGDEDVFIPKGSTGTQVVDLTAEEVENKIMAQKTSWHPKLGRSDSWSGDCRNARKKRKTEDAEMLSQLEVTKKRGNQSTMSPQEAIKVMITCTSDLKEKIKEYPNTQKQIKSLVEQLQQGREVLEVEEILRKKESQKTEEKRKLLEKRFEKLEETAAKLEREVIALKIENKGLREKIEGTCIGDKESIETFSLAGQITTYAEFLEVHSKAWSTESYRKTSVSTGDPMTNVKGNLAFFCVGKGKAETETGFLARFPEILEGEAEKFGNSGCAHLELVVTINSKEGKRITKGKTILTGILDTTPEGGDVVEDLYNIIKHMRDKLQEAGRKELDFIPAQTIATTLQRKILESVFYDTDISIKIKTRENEEGKERRRERRMSEALIVEVETGTSYADTLKKLKTSMKDDKNMLDQIKGTRRTVKGNVLLRVKENAGEALKQHIKGILDPKRVRITGGKKHTTIQVSNIDATSEETDILDALHASGTIKNRDELKITAMRPSNSGNFIATIRLEKDDADCTVARKYIKIGLNTCIVREKIELIKCFRCWEYGHFADSCTSNRDLSGDCYKCAKEGHLGKDCTNAPCCPLCDGEEHQAGSGRCKAFRKALNNERKKRTFSKETVINKGPSTPQVTGRDNSDRGGPSTPTPL